MFWYLPCQHHLQTSADLRPGRKKFLKEETAKSRLIAMMQKEGCTDILGTEINSLASVNCSVSISLGGTLDIWEACEQSSN